MTYKVWSTTCKTLYHATDFKTLDWSYKEL